MTKCQILYSYKLKVTNNHIHIIHTTILNPMMNIVTGDKNMAFKSLLRQNCKNVLPSYMSEWLIQYCDILCNTYKYSVFWYRLCTERNSMKQQLLDWPRKWMYQKLIWYENENFKKGKTYKLWLLQKVKLWIFFPNSLKAETQSKLNKTIIPLC